MSAHEAPELPARPYVPPTAAAALACCAAAAAFMEAGWKAYLISGQGEGVVRTALGALALCVAAALACTVAIAAASRLIARNSRGARARVLRRWLAFAAGGLAIGALAGCMGMVGRAGAAAGLAGRPASSLVFVTEGDASTSAYGVTMDAVAHDAAGAAIARVSLAAPAAYADGTSLELVGRVEALRDDPWDRRAYLAGQVARVQTVKVTSEAEMGGGVIAGLRSRALEVIEPERSSARALIAGIVCGRTTELNGAEEAEWFSATGTTHLIAVSGSHLALISSIALVLLRQLGTGPGARCAVLLMLMAAYVVFTGSAPSAARSFCMVGMALASTLAGRRGHGISALSLAAIALVVLDAGVVFDLGFELSALSVLFIQVFGSYGSSLIEGAGVPRSLAEALSLTLCAQWATLPVTLPVFGELSVAAPLANLVLGPLMSALLVVGVIAVGLAVAIPALAWAVALPEALAQVSLFSAELMADLPWASLPLTSPEWLCPVSYGLAVAVYLLWARLRAAHLGAALAAALAAVAIPLVCARWFAPAEVVVLDVGQADAILVREGASTLLVDAGVDDEVVRALLRQGVTHLDAVAITHWDADHYGGLEDVLATFAVDRLLVAEGALAGMPDEVRRLELPETVELGPGDLIEVGGFACRVVWPQVPVTGEGNAASLALAVDYGAQGRSLSALLTGDTEVSELERYRDAVGDIDVLKVGHHGSAASLDGESLEILDPELAIASAGEGNRYGHPSEECIEQLDEAGVPFLCTIEAGDVSVAPGCDGFTVATSRVGG